MTIEVEALRTLLEARGLHAGLAMLNSRTPHRYTGIYRYDGDVLRNVALYDRHEPKVTRGGDVDMGNAYCAIVGRCGEPLEFADSRNDTRFAHLAGSPVISYCGVLIRDDQDQPFGTLCHYDVQRCEMRVSDLPLLMAAGPLIHGIISRDSNAA